MSCRNTSKIAALVLLSFLSFIVFCHASSFRINDQNCAKYKYDPSSFPDKDFDYLLTDEYTLWSPSQNESDHKVNCLKHYWVTAERRKVLDWATAGCNLESTQCLDSPAEFLSISAELFALSNRRPVRISDDLRDKRRKEEEEESRFLYSLKDIYYKEEEEKKSGKVAEHEPHCFMNITRPVRYNRRRPASPS